VFSGFLARSGASLPMPIAAFFEIEGDERFANDRRDEWEKVGYEGAFTRWGETRRSGPCEGHKVGGGDIREKIYTFVRNFTI